MDKVLVQLQRTLISILKLQVLTKEMKTMLSATTWDNPSMEVSLILVVQHLLFQLLTEVLLTFLLEGWLLSKIKGKNYQSLNHL